MAATPKGREVLMSVFRQELRWKRERVLNRSMLQRKGVESKVLKEMEGGDVALKTSRFSAECLPRALIRKPACGLHDYVVQKKNVCFKGRSQLAVPKPEGDNSYIGN